MSIPSTPYKYIYCEYTIVLLSYNKEITYCDLRDDVQYDDTELSNS